MNALAKRAARAMFAAMPFDPAAMWRELHQDQRAAFRASIELVSDARIIGPPEPTPELAAELGAAGAAHSVPPALLAAVAWEMSGYDAAAPGGLMGLGAGIDNQVNAAAFVLRRLSDEHGLAGALVKLAGDRVTAGRIAGTMALLVARHVDAGGYATVRQAIELLEA